MTNDYTMTMNAASSGLGTGMLIGTLVVCVLFIIATWRIFTKAGEAGWKCLIPIYNIYVMYQLFWNTDKPGLMTVLTLIPGIGAILALILMYKMCASFGKGAGFFILLLIFMPIMYLVLAFGNADYIGPQ